MDCPICCEPFDSVTRKPYCLPCGHTMCAECTARQSLCPECRRRFLPSELRVVFNMIPESNPLVEDAKTKFAAEKTLADIAAKAERAKSLLNEARTLRENVRFQNAETKATVVKALDLAIDQLTKLRSQLVDDIDNSETGNSEALKQLECDLHAGITALGNAETRLRAKGRTMEDVEKAERQENELDSPRQITFVRYTAKSEFGTELLQKAAELRNGVSASQAVPVAQPLKKASFSNKYVPVTEPVSISHVATYMRPHSSVPKWFYEYKGQKKAFTPDFCAALERALQSRQGWCELRDKQQRLIFEVNLHSCLSYRPGAPRNGCPVTREL